MIDTFSLLLSHGLILIVLIKLLSRADLDAETDASGTGEDSASA